MKFTQRQPIVSVVMAVHNGERYLRAAIDSILGQSFVNLELIVVDDASTDNTAIILHEYQDNRLVVLNNINNEGPAVARNNAFDVARGVYYAILDSDDISLPIRLEKQLAYLERHPTVDFVGSNYRRMDEYGKVHEKVRMPADEWTIRWHALFQNPFINSTMMIRSRLVKELGGFSSSSDAILIEDYELWSRLIWANRVSHNIQSVLINWRENPNGHSSINANIQSRNYFAFVRKNIRRFKQMEMENDVRCDRLWRLQVQSGKESSLEEIIQSVNDTVDLVSRFSDYYGLHGEVQQHVCKIAMNRASKTLLHLAASRSYDGKLDEAVELSEMALTLNPRVRLARKYWKVFYKSRVYRTRKWFDKEVD